MPFDPRLLLTVLAAAFLSGCALLGEKSAPPPAPAPVKIGLALGGGAARGEISKCSVTRFNNGEKIEAVLCRVAGYIPPKSPGRKPGASS